MVKSELRTLTPLNTSVRRATAERQGPAVVELSEMGDHIDKLKHISLTAKNLMDLLGGQLQGLSGTIPIMRGLETMKGLREQSKKYREGLPGVLEPLRAYIEREKAAFYTKNAEAIEKKIREGVEQGVRKKLPIILKERLGRYEEYLKINGTLTDKVKQAIAVTSARDSNAVLRPNYPGDPVALIPPHPDLNITFGNLKNIGGPAIAKLAKDQGLTPITNSDPELARVQNLNMVLRHLGIHYRAIPSRNGLLLTASVMRETNH